MNRIFNLASSCALALTTLLAAPGTVIAQPQPVTGCKIDVGLDIKTTPEKIGNVEFYYLMPEHLLAAEEAFKRGVLRQCGRPYDPEKDGKKILRKHKIQFIMNMFERVGMEGSRGFLKKLATDILDAIEDDDPINNISPYSFTILDKEEARPGEFYVQDKSGVNKRIKSCLIIGPDKRFSAESFFQFLAAGRSAPALINAGGTTEDYIRYILEHEVGHGLGYTDVGADTDYARIMMLKFPEKKQMAEAVYRARFLGAFRPEAQETHGYSLAYALSKILHPDSNLPDLNITNIQRFSEFLQGANVDLTKSRGQLQMAIRKLLEHTHGETQLYTVAQEYARVLEESIRETPAAAASLNGSFRLNPVQEWRMSPLDRKRDNTGRVVRVKLDDAGLQLVK